ncbi:MAG: ATP-binding protein [Candidatus Krumholzibacteriia bacterium]
MTTPRTPSAAPGRRDLFALGLPILATAALAQLAAAPARLPTPFVAVPAAVALAVLMWRSRRWSRGTRRTRLLLTAVLALQVGLAGLGLLAARQDDQDWLADQRTRAEARLDAAVGRAAAEQADVMTHVAAMWSALPADSLVAADAFAFCAAWRDRWQAERHGRAALAVVLWRGDQRLGWAGPVIAGDGAPPLGAPSLLHDDRHWALRAVAARDTTAGDLVECQLWLADLADLDPTAGAEISAVRREVVRDARPPGRRAWGDADRGLRVVEDVVLGPGDAYGVQPRLRLSVQVPARHLLGERRRASNVLAHLLLAGLAVVLWARLGGAAGGWLAAWLVRGWWARLDVVRWFAAALPAARLPADPGSPTSLLDPAYFATTLGGGWFASGADALLTAALLGGTAAWAWRRFVPGADRPARSGVRALAVVPLVVLATVALQHLWTDIAANANARLLGLQVPLGAWTFWALHAVILMVTVAAGALLVLAALRLLGGRPRWLEGSLRPYLLVAALLAVVLVNYGVLAGAYGLAERDWLRRKAEQIVQPQDEWISFLLEDVLNDMAGQDTAGPDPAEAGPGRGALGRDRLAHRLWRRSAIRDLGLPGLVEVLDSQGETESLYATGFLRDFGYEVVERSDWWSLTGAPAGDGDHEGVLLQDELRRYPTGLERVLRGELVRPAGGWLRLELSTQSLRISTLLGRLSGAQDVRTGGGYRPRLEVDRPILLLRGDAERWLDVGFGDLPGPAAEAALLPLREGRREWAAIDLDGQRWLCRWAALPPELAGSAGEGFLLGLQRRSAVDVLLDVGRLLLLDVVLLLVGLMVLALVRRRWRWAPGFQGRFLAGYLVIGVVLLVVAGVLADRQTFERIDRDARARTRDGLVTALSQLRGLLAEQARALAGSDDMADLLAGRLSGERRLGPFAVRQAMVFGPDGGLLLDETLSDLEPDDATRLLAASREAPLLVMQQPGGVYLGVTIPIDLGGIIDAEPTTGTFFYRQLVDDQLLPGLADVVGGEVLLRIDGEVVDASHPGRVLDQPDLLLAAPELMQWYRDQPGQPRLQPTPAGLAFTGGIALPALSPGPGGGLVERALPAVLAVEFPDRERDFADERRSMALFLAGLITLLLLTAFGLAMALTWNIFEPLRVLLAAMRQLAAGDSTAPLPPGGGDEVGRLAAGFGAMRDQLQHAREVLESRERFLRAVLERVPVGVLVWDRVGRLAASNPAAAEILGRFYPDVASTGDPDRDMAAWTARLRTHLSDRLGEGTGELASSDGRRTLRVGQAPVELGDTLPHRLVVCEDLTAFLAAKKQALNAELARQVAHEIKNPLTPIQLSAQLVQQAQQDRHPRRDEIIDDAVRRILEQVTLLRSIAGEFSLLGRPGDLECEPVDLVALVNDVLAGYRSEPSGRGPRLDLAAADVPPVLAHRDSLLKIIGNLMQNSLDAAGGAENLELTVRWRVEPRTVAVVWTDNGPGIDPDVAGRLFDPYFSTKSKGTGLGLAICRNLLEKMGGSIALETAGSGSGAVATVTLPRADADPADAAS